MAKEKLTFTNGNVATATYTLPEPDAKFRGYGFGVALGVGVTVPKPVRVLVDPASGRWALIGWSEVVNGDYRWFTCEELPEEA